jgi:hypothetical protein
MRKAIRAIVDPPPRSLDPVWEYFESCCAYCGKELDRVRRAGHLDHAVAGGGNQIGNMVLSCASCNGDEKLDMHWRTFLDQKVTDPNIRTERAARIGRWIELHPVKPDTPSAEVQERVADLDRLVDEYAAKCNELRTIVRAERAAIAAASQDS